MKQQRWSGDLDRVAPERNYTARRPEGFPRDRFELDLAAPPTPRSMDNKLARSCCLRSAPLHELFELLRNLIRAVDKSEDGIGEEQHPPPPPSSEEGRRPCGEPSREATESGSSPSDEAPPSDTEDGPEGGPEFEVRTGFEPAYNGFANRCLTAWLPHRAWKARGPCHERPVRSMVASFPALLRRMKSAGQILLEFR